MFDMTWKGGRQLTVLTASFKVSAKRSAALCPSSKTAAQLEVKNNHSQRPQRHTMDRKGLT